MADKLEDICNFTGVTFSAQLPMVLLAKNGRARQYIDSKLDLAGFNVQELGAEDVPRLIAEELPMCLGITTSEYYAEYGCRRPRYSSEALEVISTLSWDDSNCKYGKPFICAIGMRDVNKSWPTRVAIKESTQLLGKLLARFYLKEPQILFIPLSREVEGAIKLGMADICLEIVGSGKTAESKYGLQILEPLFPIDIVVLGNKNYLSQLKG